MGNLRSSPERGSFQKKNLSKENDEHNKSMLKYYESIELEKKTREVDPEWQKDNLEYDLRTSDHIVMKCKKDSYAQNLYAALCNNDFIRNEVWPILKEDVWGCSWRYAGGIIADIRQEGDYIDWYCSGIKDIENHTEDNTVSEGIVTDEIREDLLQLGWIVVGEDLQQ